MVACARAALLIGLVGLGTLLTGCPGMPGAAGGEQNMPPGVLPPPGMESGGARTLMGATVTPPDDSYLLVTYTHAVAGVETTVDWQTCRRALPLQSCVLVEGINFDGRVKDAEKDVNVLIPFEGLVSFQWKYEARPAPPAEEQEQSDDE